MTTDHTEAQDGVTGAPAGRRLRVVLLAVIALGLVLIGGGLAVALGIGRTDAPESGSVDAGFARDMGVHHLQGVEMANLALERSEDPEIRQLAFDISATQTNQAGRMQGWLTLWGVRPDSVQTMAWMSGDGHGDGAAHGHDTAAHEGPMPGMATPEELADLRGMSGTAFDVEFLRLMIRHHQGGFEMAEHAVEHAEVPAVRDLAQAIAAAQSAETGTMATLLSERGGAPLPAP